MLHINGRRTGAPLESLQPFRFGKMPGAKTGFLSCEVRGFQIYLPLYSLVKMHKGRGQTGPRLTSANCVGLTPMSLKISVDTGFRPRGQVSE